MPPHAHLHAPHIHGPAGSHPYRCFYNDERRLERAKASHRLGEIGGQLSQGRLDFEEILIEIPDPVHVEIEHFEPAHHAPSGCLRFDLSWRRPPRDIHPPLPPHRRLFLYEGDLSLAETSTLMEGLAGQLDGDGDVILDQNVLEIPPVVTQIVRYELAPREDHVVKWELQWGERDGSVANRPIKLLLGT